MGVCTTVSKWRPIQVERRKESDQLSIVTSSLCDVCMGLLNLRMLRQDFDMAPTARFSDQMHVAVASSVG